jgi:hypothetical protein
MSDDDPKLYLVVDRDEHGIIKNMRLASDLDSLQSNPAPAGEATRKEVEPQKDAISGVKTGFASLLDEIETAMDSYRTLDTTMAFVSGFSRMLFDKLSLAPVMQRYCKIISNVDGREVLGFDLSHIGEITSALRQFTSSVTGARKIPDLALMGLVSEYDVLITKLIGECVSVRPEALSSMARGYTYKELSKILVLEGRAGWAG